MNNESSVRKMFWCLCGDAMQVHATIEAMPEIEQRWASVHHGDGHGPADAKTCRKARNKKRDSVVYVELLQRVASDLPFLSDCFAEPGIYEAHMNPHGAVSVRANDGELLGVKPGEFRFVGGGGGAPR